MSITERSSTTMQYSNELREAVLRRLLPPQNESISKVASAEGISEQTLRNWLAKAKTDGTDSVKSFV